MFLPNFNVKKNEPVNQNTSEKNLFSILKLKFFTFNKKHGPFEITADKAIQNDKNSILSNIKAVINGNDNKKKLIIQSNKGIVYSYNQMIKLLEYVKMQHNNHYFFTNSMYFDLANSSFFSIDKVLIKEGKSSFISNTGIIGLLTKKEFIFPGNIDIKYYLPKKNDFIFIKADNAKIFYDKNLYLLKDNVEAVFENKLLKADMVKYYQAKEIVNMVGNIIFIYEKSKIEGNSAIYDIKTQILTMKDNVKLLDKDNIIKGDYFVYSFKTNQGKIINQKNKRVKAKIELHRSK